jgi:hypothetical protein
MVFLHINCLLGGPVRILGTLESRQRNRSLECISNFTPILFQAAHLLIVQDVLFSVLAHFDLRAIPIWCRHVSF